MSREPQFTATNPCNDAARKYDAYENEELMTPHQPYHACCREPAMNSVPPSAEQKVTPIPSVQDIPPESNLSVQHAKKSLGTFEIKFLIDEAVANELLDWSNRHLDIDPHSDPEFGRGYRVNSLYLDTAQFDVFYRSEGYRQQKFRLRRYGNEPTVWFEQKRKRHGLVKKKRVGVVDTELSRRLVLPSDLEWEGHWYRQRIEERLLRPVCQITYERSAFVKSVNGTSMRLTIDHNLITLPTNQWAVPTSPLEGVTLLEGKRILELKFRGAMPVIFRDLVERHRLHVTSFSKYRTAVERCYALASGISDNRRGPADV